MKNWKKKPILIEVFMHDNLAKNVMLDLGADINLLPIDSWR